MVTTEERIIDDAVAVFLTSQHQGGLVDDERSPEISAGKDDQKRFFSQRGRVFELSPFRADPSFVVAQDRKRIGKVDVFVNELVDSANGK